MPLPLLGQRTYGAVDMIELGSPYRDAIGRPPELVSPVQLDQLEEFPWARSFFNAFKQAATVDGEPVTIAKVDGTLACIFVPPHRHVVRLDYLPETFSRAAWVSALAALILIAGTVPGHRPGRRRGQ